MLKRSSENSLMSEVDSCECLNQDSQHTIDSMLKHIGPLRSDCDAQLIMNFQFKPASAAKVQAIRLEVSQGCENRPSKIFVFVNQRNVSFASIERLTPTDQSGELTWTPTNRGVETTVIELKNARFIAAFQLTVFVVANATGDEDEVTELGGLELMGELATGLGTTELPQKNC